MASSSSSSTSYSLASQSWKYDIFLNFRGVDTRRNFISHLYAALRQKDLQTFFDDGELKTGEGIVQSLPQAIKASTVAVVVFSKDYASSAWCLDELAKIIECRQTHGQIVIPVFYEVDPSHLRKQSHNIAAAFVEHEQNLKDANKIQKWRDALTTAANLRGFDSKNFRDDHMLVNKIVEDILGKLNQLVTWDDFDFEHLVGMDLRIEEIKKIFTAEPLAIRILGIWGMAGVGKTTTAEVIYKKMSHQFQGCCFLHEVRQRVEGGGMKNLQEELVSKALGEEHSVKDLFSAELKPFLIARLRSKKMLVVLDDVDDPLQLESLIGNAYWFGSGSIILITSRDKQVFRGRADSIYEIKPLNDIEALQLFSKNAFRNKYSRNDYVPLSNLIVKFAQGNPLALKVLGSSLAGKKEEEWESAISQLSKVPNKNIQNVLQISYNSLNRVEKEVFLDIACFFKHVRQIYVDINILRKIYKSNRFNIDIILSVLVDKCLVRVFSYNMLEMHDLFQEMGKEIVLQEAKYPSQRSRLWDPEDIYEVFMENKEMEATRTILLDQTKIREINLNPKVFRRMPNLKFLDFYKNSEEESNLRLFQGLDYLPNKIKYICWNGYPLEYFPPCFQPENLVILRLPNSNVKQLRKGAKECSVAFQHAYEMLNMILHGFCSLIKVPSYKLRSLSLGYNKSITHLPNCRSAFLESLEILDLRGCSNLNIFPEISSNIKELNLSLTAIKQVPSSSVELLSKLKKLEMTSCRQLKSLPSDFFSKLTSLEELYLEGCSRFMTLPEILEPIYNLERLDLSDTAIEKLPSSVGNLKGLKHLQMSFLNFENCFAEDHHALALSSEGISFLRDLTLSNCNLREWSEDLSFLSSIENLDLNQNDFERIPATIKQLSQLEVLHINNCERFLSLPELPSSVSTVWALKQLLFDSQGHGGRFFLGNCLKLDEDECQAIAIALLRNHLTAFTRNQMRKPLESFQMGYPGSKIPKWVTYQNMGDSIQIHLPSQWFNHLFLGFAFYLCIDSVGESFHLRYDCYLGDNYHFSSADSEPSFIRRKAKEHMIVFVSRRFCEWICRHGNVEEDVAFFKFNAAKNGIKKCGVIPLHAQKDDCVVCQRFDFPTVGMSMFKRSATSAGSFYYLPKKRLKIEVVE